MNDFASFIVQHRFFIHSLTGFTRQALATWVLLGGLLLGGPAMAQTTEPQSPLSQMEKSLFSTSYPDETADARLNRLESSVFGAAQEGSEADRTERLGNALSKARRWIPTVGQESPNTLATPGEASGAESFQAVPQPQQRDATDYPTVTALEREVFGRDFVREDVVLRLNRLE